MPMRDFTDLEAPRRSQSTIDNRQSPIPISAFWRFGVSAFLSLFIATGVAQGRGFAPAIDAATSRVVKLYGLGAGAQVGYGSGILVSEDGWVLTILSLLIDARTLKVVTPDGARYEADIVYRDSEKQLALLRLKLRDEQHIIRENFGASTTPGPFPYFELSSGQPRPSEASGATPVAAPVPGDWVIAAGNAFKVADGAEPVSIAHGVFSARTRLDARRRSREFPYRGDVLVIDAVTSNPGASGGAVVDLDGHLVGMIGRDVISNLTHTYFNYAVPRDVLHAFLQEASANPECRVATPEGPAETRTPAIVGQLSREGRESADFPVADLGIRLNRAGYRSTLPFVERVRSDSAAALAGLRADDLIQSVNGKSVADAAEYDERMKSIGPQESVDLVVRRDRRILNIHIERK